MKISIITVCKNSQEYIESAIKSVAEQSYNNIEYIIVDGDSQDGTKEIIARHSKSISKFISEPDSGLYEAMNKGIKLATGEFIYFLNSDDYLVDREVIQDVVNFISENPSCDFVYGYVQQRTISGEVFEYKAPQPENLKEEMICNCAIPQPASFFKADLFDKLGLFDESYKIASDYEWFTRLMQDGTLKLYCYPRTISSYYCGGLSGNNLKLAYTEMFEIQNKIPLFHSNYWLEKRIVKLQESCAEQHELVRTLQKLAEVRQQLADEREDVIIAQEKKIAAMKKFYFWFWGIRKVWLKLKQLVNVRSQVL